MLSHRAFVHLSRCPALGAGPGRRVQTIIATRFAIRPLSRCFCPLLTLSGICWQFI